MQLEIQLLALGMVGGALGRRQIGSHQIFVDLGKQGLVGVHVVEDATCLRVFCFRQFRISTPGPGRDALAAGTMVGLAPASSPPLGRLPTFLLVVWMCWRAGVDGW